MPLERTLSIIKPDAVRKHYIGAILARFEQTGFTPVAMKMVQLTKSQAEGFYIEHEGREFYPALVEFMTSGPVLIQVLQADNVIINRRTKLIEIDLPIRCIYLFCYWPCYLGLQ